MSTVIVVAPEDAPPVPPIRGEDQLHLADLPPGGFVFSTATKTRMCYCVARARTDFPDRKYTTRKMTYKGTHGYGIWRVA